MVQAIPAVIGAGAAIYSANKQSAAMKKARNQYAAQEAASQARLAPYQQVGLGANRQIQNDLANGTLGGSFMPTDLSSDPGYQFRLAQAAQARDRLQSARGNIFSGQALKEADRQTQGLAAQEYQDAYNRWLQTQQNRYNILSGQQRVGLGAAGGQNDLSMDLGLMTAASTLGRQQSENQGLGTVAGLASSAYTNYLDQKEGLTAY